MLFSFSWEEGNVLKYSLSKIFMISRFILLDKVFVFKLYTIIIYYLNMQSYDYLNILIINIFMTDSKNFKNTKLYN
jgi:hypothetical protein